MSVRVVDAVHDDAESHVGFRAREGSTGPNAGFFCRFCTKELCPCRNGEQNTIDEAATMCNPEVDKKRILCT